MKFDKWFLTAIVIMLLPCLMPANAQVLFTQTTTDDFNKGQYVDLSVPTTKTDIITTCQTFTACPGSTTVAITVDEFAAIGAASLALSYNTSVLTFNGFQNLNSALFSGLLNVNAVGGMVYISWSHTAPATIPNGETLIELNFTSLPGTSSMNWDTQTPGNCEYSMTSGQIVFSTWVNGTLTFQQSPIINTQPLHNTIYGGGSTNFSVSASGPGINYQWQLSTDGGATWNNLSNGSPYSGETTATLTVNPATVPMNNYMYRCHVGGTCAPSAISDMALLTVTTTAVITSVVNTSYSCAGIVNVPINVANCNNVGGISLVLKFDTTKLTYQGYDNVNQQLVGGLLSVNSTQGKVHISWSSVTPAFIANGTLLKLKFIPNVGISTTLTWENQISGNCEYNDTQGNIITSFYNNGNVNITNNYPVYSQTASAFICQGDTLFFGTQTLTAAGVYTEIFQSAQGCDSVYTLQLTVNPLPIVELTGLLSEYCYINQNYLMQGTPVGGSFSGAGVTVNSFNPHDAGSGTWPILYCYADVNNCVKCDTFLVTVNPAFEFTQDEEICFGDTLQWRGNSYYTAGTYYDSLSTQQGCDSVYLLNLTVNPFYYIVEPVSVCAGSPYTWHGQTLTLPGVYYDSLVAVTGCDSVCVLNLSHWSAYQYVTADTICAGDTYYWRGNYYNNSGIYTVPFTSINGCDSIYTLELNLRDLPVVAVSGAQAIYCVYNPPVTLSGTPTGGVFSGQGMSGSIFSPTTAGIGNWMIVYGFADTHGCFNADTIFIDVDACVGVEETAEQKIRLYPNPNNGNFTLELDEEALVTVYNAIGSVIFERVLSKGSNKLNLSYLPAGLYTIKADSLKESRVLKFIIE